MNDLGDERLRRRLLERVRRFLAIRRSPRLVLSMILALTGLVGLIASMALLRMGLTDLWLRYPLAVLISWAAFLGMVRWWAESERTGLRLEEELATLDARDDPFDGQPGRAVLEDRGWRSSRWWDWLDVPDLFSFADDVGGCLIGIVILIAGGLLFGTAFALGGLIVQAEILLAEVLLDAVLISALSRRLRHLEPRWWLDGVVRQTVKPVLWTMAFLCVAGFLIAHFAPGADTIGDLWRTVGNR